MPWQPPADLNADQPMALINSLASKVPGPGSSDLIQITIFSDFNKWIASALLQNSFIRGIAAAAGISVDRIVVLNVLPGSVILSFKILPGPGPTVGEAVSSLQARFSSRSLDLGGLSVDYSRCRVFYSDPKMRELYKPAAVPDVGLSFVEYILATLMAKKTSSNAAAAAVLLAVFFAASFVAAGASVLKLKRSRSKLSATSSGGLDQP
eukprot:tig00000178_g12793.t1